MLNTKHLTSTESTAINCVKAFSVLSVIAAHTVLISETNLISNILSVLWTAFGRVGVVAFFIVGGFFYSRRENDSAEFWKKKFFRLIVPWLVCSAATFALNCIGNRDVPISVSRYLCWIFGSGTWYYYFTIYTLFLLVFKMFHKQTFILYSLVILQTAALILETSGIHLTPATPFLTDFLNPIYWVGYFSLGILARKYNLHRCIQRHAFIPILSVLVMVGSLSILYFCNIVTYFDIFTSIYCVSTVVLIYRFSLFLSRYRISAPIGNLGAASYCIYLLHMQIVQLVVFTLLPTNTATIAVAPFIGLCVMAVFVSFGSFVCNKLPLGNTLKMIVGLPCRL